MAPKTFLLLALACAVVLLVASQVATADSELDGRGGYNRGGGYKGGGGHGGYKGGHHGGGGGGYNKGGGHHGGGYGCKYGCCGGGRYKGCKCCSTLEEATAYKQTQN